MENDKTKNILISAPIGDMNAPRSILEVAEEAEGADEIDEDKGVNITVWFNSKKSTIK